MSLEQVPVVTIDGPSGVGKGTVGRAVASQLGWHYLDSGAIYRSLGIAASRAGIDVDEVDELVRLAEEMVLEFRIDDETKNSVPVLDGDDVSDEISTEACGNFASKIAAIPHVRQALLNKQRDFAKKPGLVADGRDMGSVVFPDANFKFYLSASTEERAKRRYNQLIGKGFDANLGQLTNELIERDRRDSERAVAPLVAPEDAFQIDSTDLMADQVIEIILEQIA